MNHVGSVLAQNVCDSPREERIFMGFTTAISGIFMKKETRLIYRHSVMDVYIVM